MGFSVMLEDEDGAPLEQLDDSKNLLKTLLPLYEGKSFHHLRLVDPYGDTVFNRPQMEAFMEQWQRLVPKLQSADAKEIHTRVP